jgi:hypothetical protein
LRKERAKIDNDFDDVVSSFESIKKMKLDATTDKRYVSCWRIIYNTLINTAITEKILNLELIKKKCKAI